MVSLEVQCVAHKPRALLVAALAATIALCGLAFVLYAPDFSSADARGFPYAFVALHAAALAIWGLFAHVQRRVYARRVPGAAHVSHRELVHRAGQAKLTVLRSAVRMGAYHAGRLRLLGPMQRVLFEAEMSERQAVATLRALGLDAASHRAEFSGSSPAFSTLPRQIALMGVAALLFSPLHVAGSLGSVLFAVLLALAFWPSRITAGIDGFMLRWLWWQRFVPMSEVRELSSVGERDVKIELTSGAELVWYTSMRSKSTTAVQREHRDAVLARMQEVMKLSQARPRATHLATAVARAGRTHEQWLEALRQMRHVEADYRSAAVPRDALWRVLDDPAAPEDARAGAAFVLHEGAGEADEVRLRNAAGATASPRLRIALDSAADGNDEELAAALEDVELERVLLERRRS